MTPETRRPRVGRPLKPEEERKVTFNVALSLKQRRRLQEEADAAGVSISEMMRQALEEHWARTDRHGS